MKTAKSLSILALLAIICGLPAPALAEQFVQCDVKLNSENHFAYLANGKAYTDLSTGVLFVKTEAATVNLITDEYVSTRKALATTCSLDKAIESDTGGELKSYKFYFVDCLLPGKYITASNSYNWKTNRGVYQEALSVNGNYAITYFFLENCKH